MCKEVWCVGLGQKGLHDGERNRLNYLKGGGTEKRGRETKILKRGRKLGYGVGVFNVGWVGWNLLTNYV